MTTDEPGAGAIRDEVDRPATHRHNLLMSGIRVGLVVQAGAAVLYAVLFAVGPKDCYIGLTIVGALYITIIVDVLAGVITFLRVARSNPHRGAVAAGLALSYLLPLVAASLITAWMMIATPFACAD